MSALCTVLVMDGPAVAGNALPSPEKHLRMRFRRGIELSSDEGTTPEASTDSDNDSAFDFSDDEMAGSKRGPPPTALPLGATPANALEVGRWRHSRGSLSPPPRQPQRKQPLPRRVRFKLDDDNDKTTTSTTDQPVDYAEYVQLWGGQQRRAAIQESALLALGMMGPTAAGSGTARGLHGKRRSFGGAAAAATTGKSAIFTAPPPTSAFSPNGGYRSQKTARKAAWNKRTVVLPLGRSNANNVHDASSTSANTLANASVNVKAIARNSTPSSPKKRRMLPPSSMLRLRARGGGCGGDKKSKRRTSRGVGNLAELFKAAAAVTTPGSGLAPPARPARSEPTPELTCEESLDVDAVMKPKGEVRTPICRLLLPCWPEGVEGYEEAGGWRRLGGATSQALPRGSR